MRRRTLRHPIHGDRVYARSAAHRSRKSTRRVRQPRIRPRKSVNVAALVASPEEQTGRPGLRLIIVGLVVVLLFGILILRLWTLQVIDSKNYAAAVSTNSVRVVSVPAPRGQITDRSNTVLVGNQLVQEIVLSRVEATQHPEVIGQVAALVGETPAEVTADVNNPRYSPYQPVPIQSNASPATVQYLETHASEYPGVSVQQVTQRSYPQQATATQNSVASQVLGYVGDISSAQLAANPNQGYELGSMFGQAGLEGEYEKYLRGEAGQQALEVDSAGDVVGTLRKTQPTPGDTLVTNLDLGLQEQVELALQADIEADRQTRDHTTGALPQADNGAAVVMDVNTGQVLAMASYPTYDLNDWTGGISQANYAAISASGAENNNAIQGLYTPGSTFKLATATAALQDGIIGPNTYYNDTGTYTARNCIPGTSAGLCQFKDDDNAGQGEITITGALTASSDAFFYNLGDLFWQSDNRAKFGDTPVQSVAMEYGLGELTGIDLPYEVQGRVDSQATADKLHQEAPNVFAAETWNAGDNIEMAFGQGATVVTPISMAQAYATFANGGTRYQPQVANALVDPTTGKVVKQFDPGEDGHHLLLAGQLPGDAAGLPRRREQPQGHGQQHVRPDLEAAVQLPGGRQDRHGRRRRHQGAQRLVRLVRPRAQPQVRDRRGGRQGWLRRPGGRPGGGQHLELPLRQPGQPGGAPDGEEPADRHPAGHPAPDRHPGHDHHHHDHAEHDHDDEARYEFVEQLHHDHRAERHDHDHPGRDRRLSDRDGWATGPRLAGEIRRRQPALSPWAQAEAGVTVA